MKNNIHVLDCTLRDGGYVNNWHFGADNAHQITELMGSTGVDYVELGFIKHCDYERDVIQFNDMKQVEDVFLPSKANIAIMVEIGYGYPVTAFPECSESTAKLIRLVVWKRMIKESVEYAKALKAKGYDVGIQATRTDQYSLEEFADFIHQFNEVNPKSLYIVDTFGLMDKQFLLNYAEVADKELADGIWLGYHAHNNMQQAFSNAVAMCEHEWHRDIMLDASALGMGRGAGNLCMELLIKHLNEHYSKTLDPKPVYDVIEHYLMPFYNQSPWGYALPYLLSAINGCNPTYVHYMQEKMLKPSQMNIIFQEMRKQDAGIRFQPELCDKLCDDLNI